MGSHLNAQMWCVIFLGLERMRKRSFSQLTWILWNQVVILVVPGEHRLKKGGSMVLVLQMRRPRSPRLFTLHMHCVKQVSPWLVTLSWPSLLMKNLVHAPPMAQNIYWTTGYCMVMRPSLVSQGTARFLLATGASIVSVSKPGVVQTTPGSNHGS